MPRLPSFAFLACAVCCFAAPPDAPLSLAKDALAGLPLRFEANQGQFGPAVEYAAHAPGYDLLLTRKGPTLALRGSQPVELSLERSNPAPQIEGLDPMLAHRLFPGQTLQLA